MLSINKDIQDVEENRTHTHTHTHTRTHTHIHAHTHTHTHTNTLECTPMQFILGVFTGGT